MFVMVQCTTHYPPCYGDITVAHDMVRLRHRDRIGWSGGWGWAAAGKQQYQYNRTTTRKSTTTINVNRFGKRVNALDNTWRHKTPNSVVAPLTQISQSQIGLGRGSWDSMGTTSSDCRQISDNWVTARTTGWTLDRSSFGIANRT